MIRQSSQLAIRFSPLLPSLPITPLLPLTHIIKYSSSSSSSSFSSPRFPFPLSVAGYLTYYMLWERCVTLKTINSCTFTTATSASRLSMSVEAAYTQTYTQPTQHVCPTFNAGTNLVCVCVSQPPTIRISPQKANQGKKKEEEEEEGEEERRRPMCSCSTSLTYTYLYVVCLAGLDVRAMVAFELWSFTKLW